MTRILLVDDSPHAQRMGERILSEEGYEVVTVSNADSALIRLEDVDPDIVIADTVMPGRTGYDICQYIKMSPRHRYVRVIVTAGVLETLDEEHARQVEADGVLKKPFEATVLLAAIKPLAEAAKADREAQAPDAPKPAGAVVKKAAAPFIAVVDEEQVRAAVTVALDASMASMVDEITKRVLAALASKTPDPAAALAPAVAAPVIKPAMPVPPPKPEPAPPIVEPVRRVSPVRLRSSSILGLDVGPHEPES
ncbi:MAG TPA: response regulator [Candidatus Solibacter sp.]|nr:response regulator [Candidatus Solibacter sp.]